MIGVERLVLDIILLTFSTSTLTTLSLISLTSGEGLIIPSCSPLLTYSLSVAGLNIASDAIFDNFLKSLFIFPLQISQIVEQRRQSM